MAVGAVDIEPEFIPDPTGTHHIALPLLVEGADEFGPVVEFVADEIVFEHQLRALLHRNARTAAPQGARPVGRNRATDQAAVPLALAGQGSSGFVEGTRFRPVRRELHRLGRVDRERIEEQQRVFIRLCELPGGRFDQAVAIFDRFAVLAFGHLVDQTDGGAGDDVVELVD